MGDWGGSGEEPGPSSLWQSFSRLVMAVPVRMFNGWRPQGVLSSGKVGLMTSLDVRRFSLETR